MHISIAPKPLPISDPVDPLRGLLADAVERNGASVAVHDDGGSLTYADLDRQAVRVASALRQRGLRPGDRVMSLLPDSRSAVVLLYAAVYAGLTFVPIDRQTSVYRLRWLVADARPKLVVTSPERQADAARAGAEAAATPSDTGYQDAADLPQADGTVGHPAFLMYTSGTTSQPRGVICPPAQVDFAARAIAARLAYAADDVVMSRSPLSFDYGLYQVLLCALAGAALVLAGDDGDVTLLARIHESQATVLPLVPGLATMLAQLAARRPTTTRVRMVTNTGAALTEPIAARIRHTFPDAAIRFMYGLTECKRITVSDPDDDLAHPGSVGFALPGTEVTVVDSLGEPVPPGEVGQIVATGPHVMTGYWNDPAATAERFVLAPDGRSSLLTGDYGRLDANGRLYFSGRRDDVFKRRGVRMSTQEIEAAMLDVPGVHAAAVLPLADGRLVAWAAADVSGSVVLAGVAERLGTARTPDECVLLAELPLTANGKTDRAALRASREST